MKPTIPFKSTFAAVAIATVGIVGLHATSPAKSRPSCECQSSEPVAIEPVIIERHFAEPPPPPAPEPDPIEPARRPLPVTSD